MRITWVVCIFVLTSGWASAVTISVPGDLPTIQAAIDSAAISDTVLVADGTFSGTGNVNLDFHGRDIVLISENGPHYTIIDCDSISRAFYLHSGETSAAEIIGFTVSDGLEFDGGGIHIVNSSPTIKYCIVKDCSTPTQGGGVYVFQGAPTLIKCVLHNNDANQGGALSAEISNVTINSCVIAANTSSG